MPTIRAIYKVSIQTEVVITRDFYKNREFQLAKALYDQLTGMDEDNFIDFLIERMTLLDEGQSYQEQTNGAV